MSEKAEIIYFDKPFLIRVPAEGGGFKYAIARDKSTARDIARSMGATDLEEMGWQAFFTPTPARGSSSQPGSASSRTSGQKLSLSSSHRR